MTVTIENAAPALAARPFSHYQDPVYDRLLRAYRQTPLWLVARPRGGTSILATWLLFETPANYLTPPAGKLARVLDRHLLGMHGPVLADGLSRDDRQAVITVLLETVRRRSTRTAPISLRLLLDPVMTPELRADWTRAASGCGFDVKPSWTYLARLPDSKEMLLAGIKSDRRTKIRKAEKAGVTFACDPTTTGLRAYYELRLATLARNGHQPLPFAHFSDTLEVMGPPAIFKVFLARLGDRIGAGQLAFVYNGYVHLSGVSIADWVLSEGIPANDYLQWSILAWALEQGCHSVDFVGAVPESPDPKQKSIDAFKARWGTELTESLELTMPSVPIRRYALGALRRLSLAGTP